VIVDAHHHLWDPATRDYPWLAELDPIRRRYDVADLRGHTAAAGVTRTVLVQTVSDIGETKEFLALANAHRDLIAGVVGWVDLTSPSVPDVLARLRDLPGGDLLAGIRHQAQDEPDAAWLARTDVRAGVRAVVAAGLVYDLLVLPHQLAAATTLVRAVPDGRFVLDHAAKPPIASGALQPWAGSIRALAALPNVACKVSGLVTEARSRATAAIRPYTDVVLTSFGADRVMFGSDWPVCELVCGYADVVALAAALTDGHDTARVFGGTATAWYGLP
jgi:L-fuconolactonase